MRSITDTISQLSIRVSLHLKLQLYHQWFSYIVLSKENYKYPKSSYSNAQMYIYQCCFSAWCHDANRNRILLLREQRKLRIQNQKELNVCWTYPATENDIHSKTLAWYLMKKIFSSSNKCTHSWFQLWCNLVTSLTAKWIQFTSNFQ